MRIDGVFKWYTVHSNLALTCYFLTKFVVPYFCFILYSRYSFPPRKGQQELSPGNCFTIQAIQNYH